MTTPDPVTRAREIVERWESEWTWLGRSPRSKQELIDAIAAALAERDAALAEARRALAELLGALDAQAALPGLSGADHRDAEARVDRALTAARAALPLPERGETR